MADTCLHMLVIESMWVLFGFIHVFRASIDIAPPWCLYWDGPAIILSYCTIVCAQS